MKFLLVHPKVYFPSFSHVTNAFLREDRIDALAPGEEGVLLLLGAGAAKEPPLALAFPLGATCCTAGGAERTDVGEGMTGLPALHIRVQSVFLPHYTSPPSTHSVVF